MEHQKKDFLELSPRKLESIFKKRELLRIEEIKRREILGKEGIKQKRHEIKIDYYNLVRPSTIIGLFLASIGFLAMWHVNDLKAAIMAALTWIAEYFLIEKLKNKK